MQQQLIQEKSKTDIVFDIIKNAQRGGRIDMPSLEKLLTFHGIAPNWRKFYLRNLALKGKIHCDGAFVYLK